MKTFVKYVFAFVILGSGSVFAQKSSIDSPHNYKRPVFQQRKALSESRNVTVLSQPSYQIKNDISSVHNYKRQGRVDFASEAALVVQMPATEPMTLNPLLSANHYKSHARTSENSSQMAVKKGNLNRNTINMSKKDSTKIEID